jgi:hypothetical protein
LIVFEIEGVERAVNADEALALLTALYDHAARVDSTLGHQLARRVDSELQRWVARQTIRLSPEERRELLPAMEAAELGHLADMLSTLRSAIWSAELTDDVD